MQVDQQLHADGGARPVPALGALVRVVTADLQLLAGLAAVAAAALARDVVTSARPATELALAVGLGAVLGLFVHRLVHPAHREAWPPAPPVPGGAAGAGGRFSWGRGLPRAAVLTAAAGAVVAAAAVAVPDVGLALVPVGLAVALTLRVAALVRWERERGRQLLAPADLRPLPSRYRSRPRL